MSAVAMVTRTPEGGGMKMTRVDVEKMKKRRGRSKDSEMDENRNTDDARRVRRQPSILSLSLW